MARFLQNVLPTGFTKIRYYGLRSPPSATRASNAPGISWNPPPRRSHSATPGQPNRKIFLPRRLHRAHATALPRLE